MEHPEPSPCSKSGEHAGVSTAFAGDRFWTDGARSLREIEKALPGWTFLNGYGNTPDGQLFKIQSELRMQEKLGIAPVSSRWGFDGGSGIAPSSVNTKGKNEHQGIPSNGACDAAAACGSRVEVAAVPRAPTRKTQLRVDVPEYATVNGSHHGSVPMAKSAYLALCEDRGSYDFFIDGIALKCYKRASESEPHQEAKPTAAELAMFREYVVKGGFGRPCSMRADGGSCDPNSAIRLFDSMRKKLDINRGPRLYTLLHNCKGYSSELRSFEFDPPDDVSWVLIMPIKT